MLVQTGQGSFLHRSSPRLQGNFLLLEPQIQTWKHAYQLPLIVTEGNFPDPDYPVSRNTSTVNRTQLDKAEKKF
jgi:hypothetical protein